MIKASAFAELHHDGEGFKWIEACAPKANNARVIEGGEQTNFPMEFGQLLRPPLKCHLRFIAEHLDD